MTIFDRIKETAAEVKAAAVVAKVNYDLGQAGYKPEDYASFDKEPERSNNDE